MLPKLLTIALIYFEMCDASSSGLSEFFRTKNLALITWQHGVNNKTSLENTLKSDIQMLEADVQLGNLTDLSQINIPIMAHPPAKISNLSLEQFVVNVSEFNAKNSPHNQKGVKLDFKSIEAFDAAIPILRGIKINQFPLWLNADIIKGPGNSQSTPVEPQKFLEKSKQFPNATLSVGWTTNYNAGTANLTYTRDDVTRMLDALNINGINQSVSFPVRAVYAAESTAELRELMGNYTGATLTVWGADTDNVNVKHLQGMMDTIGLDKIYVDVPKNLMEQLDFSGTSRSTTSLGLLSVISVFLMFFNYI